MSRPTRDGAAEPVSRDQILRREWGQRNIHFHVQLTTSRIMATLLITRLIDIFLLLTVYDVMTIHSTSTLSTTAVVLYQYCVATCIQYTRNVRAL